MKGKGGAELNDNLTSGQLIKQLHDAIERQANNSLRQNDLTMVQVWVLLSLNEKDEKTYSLKELERILGVAQSTCAGIVNRLALKKLVDCFTDPNDKRMKLVRITPAGENAARTLYRIAEKWNKPCFTDYLKKNRPRFTICSKGYTRT